MSSRSAAHARVVTPSPQASPEGRVLVVEDHASVGRGLAQLLEGAGHQVEWVRFGAQAWDWIGRWQPELVILDLALPDADGVAILHRIKTEPVTRDVPVVVIAAGDDRRGRALAARADDCFTRPVDGELLLARARVLIETHRVHRGLLARRARLAAENAQLRRWARFWAHDLRNALAIVTSNADCARRMLARGDAAGAAEALGDVLEGAAAIEKMAEEVGKPDRLGAAGLVLRMSDVSLAELADEARAQVRALARDRAIAVEGDATVRADADLIRRVLLNLLHNACQHAAGSPIDVIIRGAADGARVQVRDRGPGVTDAVRERVNTPVPVQLTDDQRHGLGLAFCKSAIEAHGGALGVEPATGGGARFWFTIPVS